MKFQKRSNDNGSNNLSLEPVSADTITESDDMILSLAELPEKAILTEAAMARVFGVTGRTIRRMVNRHEIPPPFMMGGKSSWFAGRVLAWIEKTAERQEKESAQIIAKIAAFGG